MVTWKLSFLLPPLREERKGTRILWFLEYLRGRRMRWMTTYFEKM